MQIQEMQSAIQNQNINGVRTLLMKGFNPNQNISARGNHIIITPIIYALGLASIPNHGPYRAKPIAPQSAKEIAQSLQNYGANQYLFEFREFVNEMNWAHQNVYHNDEAQIVEKIQQHLNAVNKVQAALKATGLLFIFGFQNNQSNTPLPKDVVRLVIFNLSLTLNRSINS